MVLDRLLGVRLLRPKASMQYFAGSWPVRKREVSHRLSVLVDLGVLLDRDRLGLGE